jgi:hypothetical protein
MAARLNRRHQDLVRAKIQASQIINRLRKHIEGEVELSATQVRAAEILLNKSLPNLQATEAVIEHVVAERDLSDAELTAIAAGGSAGVIEQEVSENSSTGLH